MQINHNNQENKEETEVIVKRKTKRFRTKEPNGEVPLHIESRKKQNQRLHMASVPHIIVDQRR